MSTREPLANLVAARGDAPFLVGPGHESCSGTEFAGQVAAARARLDEDGSAAGRVVAVDLMSDVASLATFVAHLDRGDVVLPLSPREPALARRALAVRVADFTLAGGGTILSTSGSMGAPKLVVHSNEAHRSSAARSAAACGFRPGHTWLLSLPLHHVGGLQIVMRAILSGGAIAIGGVLENALLERGPTHVSLVATQLRRLLESPPATAALQSAEMVLLGGGPVPVALREHAVREGIPIAVSYGSTESTALACMSTDPGDLARENCAGRPFVAGDVRINAQWEIEIRGPTLFSGYLQRDGLQRPLTRDGWFATGDLGRLEEGTLFVEGRRDRQFISGGENVHPERIEAALRSQPGVERAVVVSVPDEEFGMRPVAFLQTSRPRAAIEAALREQVPGYMVPAAFYELPHALAGPVKPALLSLAEMACAPSASRLQSLR